MSIREAISTPQAPAAAGPYSQAIRAGDLVFTAGQLGMDPASGELASDIAGQAERALRNLEAILTASGSGLDRLVLGSVAATVARKAPCSVLLISPEAALAQGISNAVLAHTAPAWHRETAQVAG